MANGVKNNNHNHNNGKPSKKKMKVLFKMKLDWKNVLLYGTLFFIGLFFFVGLVNPPQFHETISLSQVLADIKDGKVEEITVEAEKLTVKEKENKTFLANKEASSNIYQVFKDAGIDAAKVKITVKDQALSNAWVNVLSTFLPIIVMVLFFLFLFRQARGAQESIFSFGQSRAKLFNKDMPHVTFVDVAGVDEAKKELEEIVDFLKNPAKYKVMGARTPKGVLLVGAPGTGKTLLARALAGEAHVPFFSMAGSEFMEMLVGVGSARMRDLFNTAKKNSPAIIFIDEVESIGRARSQFGAGSHDEREQTLNQMLVEMDGFTPNDNVVVVAASNRPDLLDSALLRPGRFDRRVVLDMPDIEGRKAILQIHGKGKTFTGDIDWEKAAKRTVGFSGADLENMLNEAAILAARIGKKAIDMTDLEEAATRVKLGPEKKRLQSEDDKKMTAYHEAGHALVSYAMPHTDPVHRISIVSRGLSLGHTLIPPAADRVHETKSRLIEQLSVMLGGRAAEELVFKEMTTGAADDIGKASDVARSMVVDYGMSELGPINLSGQPEPGHLYFDAVQISPEMASKIDREVKSLIDSAYKKAVSILTKLRDKLDVVAQELVKKETLEREDFERLVGPKTKLALAKA